MWRRFVRFALVGGLGYGVNLVVYASLVTLVGVTYLAAATISFLIAVTANYLLNRAWTFSDARAAFVSQGGRFLVVSLAGLALNLLALHLFVRTGVPRVVAQAAAILLALPVNFLGNHLWSFRQSPPVRASGAPVTFAPATSVRRGPWSVCRRTTKPPTCPRC
jgi:putative flippase GtrA